VSVEVDIDALGGMRSLIIPVLDPGGTSFRDAELEQPDKERKTMRYRTKDGLLIDAETSLDVVRSLREASWGEQGLSNQAFMEAVADRMYEQGIHVSTVSADIFVAGLVSAGLLTREIEGVRRNETGEQIDN
jgi:hypothetical protein